MERLTSAFGLLVLLGIAFLLSRSKKSISYRCVLSGVALQIVLAILALKTQAGKLFFGAARDFVNQVISFSDAGAELIFGENFREHFVAFSVLPTIIFVSSLMAVLFHLGLIQRLVRGMAWVMVKLMNVSGAESLAASANVFVGQTEAPLVVKPYIQSMTRSEIMAMMTGGLATVAGGVLAAYTSFGIDAGHLLTASIMSAPASLVMAKMLVPETEVPMTRGEVKIELKSESENVLDAACKGASDGLLLALNVAAMLIAFLALAALINYVLGFLPAVGDAPLTVERMLGWIFAPFAWLMGVPAKDMFEVGALLGKKTFLNEFVAYLDLQKIKESIEPRSFVIATYALCGFANFSSIAIQIGGIGSLVPEKRKDLAKLGVISLLGGTFAAFMTACVAGILL